MRSFRRLPPILRVVSLLGLLAILASFGVKTWAWWLGQESGQWSQHLDLVGFGLLQLGLTYFLMGIAYNPRHPARFAPVPRPARVARWLDTWRGQLISALVASTVPMATVIVTLAVSPDTPPVLLAYPVKMVFLVAWFVWFTVWGWAMM